MSVLRRILSYEWNPFAEKDPKPEWEFLKEIKNLEELEEFLREVEGFLGELKRKYQAPPYPFEDEEIEEDASNAGMISVLLDYLADPIHKNFNPLPFPKGSIPKDLLKKAQRLSEELRNLSDRLEEYLQPTFKTVKVSEEEALEGLREIEEKLNWLKRSGLNFKELDGKLLELREELKRFEPYSVDFLGKDFLEASEKELREEEVKRHNYSARYWELKRKLEEFHKKALKKWIEHSKDNGTLWEGLKLGKFEDDTPELIEKMAKQRALSGDRDRVVRDLKEILKIFEAEEKVYKEGDHTETFKMALTTISMYADVYLMELKRYANLLPGFEDLTSDIEDKHLEFLKWLSDGHDDETIGKRAEKLLREFLLVKMGLDPKRFNPPFPNERLFKLLRELSPQEFEELKRHFGLKGDFDRIEG